MCLSFKHIAREETREVCKKEDVFSHSHNNSRVRTYVNEARASWGVMMMMMIIKGPMNIDQGGTWIEGFGEI